MNKNIWIVVGILAIVVVVGGIYASISNKNEAMMEKSGDTIIKDEPSMMDKGDTVMKTGSYEAYSPDKLALAEKGKVVLFFRASWCPTCRALDASIRSNLGAIPEGVTILDVDYDNSTALKQKYGVTYQHTIVQVDASGGQIAKWTGSPTLTDLISQIK